MNVVEMVMDWQRSPIRFVGDTFNLIPQPLKPEYKTDAEIFIKNGQWDRIKVEFFEKFERGNHISWQQWLTLLAVEKALSRKLPRRISVVSGHKCGKTASMAWIILWFLMCHENAQVGVTAPSSDQIHDVLWKEIKLWLDKMPGIFSSQYEWTTGYIRMKARPETWFARARTARKENPEAIAGLHGDNVLIVVDEASGVEDIIYRSAEASLASENALVILIGNGTKNLGYFYETHNNDKHNWQTLQFNTEQSPVATDEYIDRMRDKYSYESDEYKIRVLGGFPSSEQMDETGWIPLITDRDVRQVSDNIPFIGRKFLGIDPSGEGKDTTRWVLRDRFQAKVIHTESISSDKGIAKVTYDIIKEYELNSHDVITGNFGVGANIRAELLLLDRTMDIVAINEGEKPSDEELFINVRAENCFKAKDWLMRGGAIVGDELKRDILGFAYKSNRLGKKVIMDKPNLKKRVGRSPDRADAFFLSFTNDIIAVRVNSHPTPVVRHTYKNLHDAI